MCTGRWGARSPQRESLRLPDHDASRDRWPRFELVTFSQPSGIPNGWDAELLEKGVPKSLLGRYSAIGQLVLLGIPGYGPLVCFGVDGVFVKICLDPHTGEVVDVVLDKKPGKQPSSTHGPAAVIRPPLLVNSSLNLFIESVQAVLNRFPFDSGDSVREVRNAQTDGWAIAEERMREWDRAVRELAEALRQIDPPAIADESSFWRTFMDDVQMGDFSTEDVLSHFDA